MLHHVLVIGPWGSITKEVSAMMPNAPVMNPNELLQSRINFADPLGSFLRDYGNATNTRAIAYEMMYGNVKWRKKSGFVTVDFPMDVRDVNQIDRIFGQADNHRVCILCSPGADETLVQSLKEHYVDMVFEVQDREDVCRLLSNDANFGRVPHLTVPISPNIDFGEICVLANAIETAEVIHQCLALSGSNRNIFPGTHPIHVTRETLTTNLPRFPYLISKKIDGTRYLMIVLEARLWFMNRKMEIWKGPLYRPLKIFNNTVMDVEMREQLVTIIDVINVQGTCIRSWELLRRWGAVRRLASLLETSPLRVQMQRYYEMRELPTLVDTLDERYDGLVFTPKKTSYRLGRNNNLFKWKPPKLNTVDFLYNADERQVYCQSMDELVCYGKVMGVPDTVQDGDIIECNVDLEDKIWHFARVRHDKINSNPDWIVENIIDSVQDNITTEELLTALSLPRH